MSNGNWRRVLVILYVCLNCAWSTPIDRVLIIKAEVSKLSRRTHTIKGSSHIRCQGRIKLVGGPVPNPVGAYNTLIKSSWTVNDAFCTFSHHILNIFSSPPGWLGSRVLSVLDSGAEEPGFKSHPRRCRVTVLGKLFTPIVPLFTKQRNW